MKREIPNLTQSLRSTRARALAPRIAVYAVLLILCIAGLRAIIAGPAEPAAGAAPAAGGPRDPAAEAFAEGFTAVYLTWDGERLESRERQLAAYIPAGVDGSGGFSPAPGTSQRIVWTAAMGADRSGSVLNVTVVARTEKGKTIYLTVPVGRDESGFLFLAGYPALVGAPPVAGEAQAPLGEEVTDEQLETVIGRALTNYLAGNRDNLLADLTPDAVVSMPELRLHVTDVETPTWVIPNRRVAVLVIAQDQQNNAWTLRYELDVRRSDRWYVRGIEVDPTLKGGA